MKKLRRAALVLLMVSSVLMTAFLLYDRMITDRQAPVIECPREVLELSISDPETVLLAGITAEDDRSGDVTDTVVVEKISPITPEHTRTVTYAAVDDSGNVSRATRSVHYTDYEPPHYSSTQALRIPKGASLSMLFDSIRAESPIDGNLTPRIKFWSLNPANWQELNQQTMELRVMDSFGWHAVLTIDLPLYDPAEETIQVDLSDYLIYLPAGRPLVPMNYYQGASEEGTLKIDSDVNSDVPGVYTVRYTVTGEQEGRMGSSCLAVVVE